MLVAGEKVKLYVEVLGLVRAAQLAYDSMLLLRERMASSEHPDQAEIEGVAREFQEISEELQRGLLDLRNVEDRMQAYAPPRLYEAFNRLDNFGLHGPAPFDEIRDLIRVDLGVATEILRSRSLFRRRRRKPSLVGVRNEAAEAL
ncbi:hypothetical protein [Micromonospora sp. Mcm103]|uniref:hypothetical protein n=1 Tax=Micromonospora sp. Mcm103 TaxID=2926015 RepID=UPI0021C5D76F|nr:hypothetical protein [Micromonospora sp. Mcm103]